MYCFQKHGITPRIVKPDMYEINYSLQHKSFEYNVCEIIATEFTKRLDITRLKSL